MLKSRPTLCHPIDGRPPSSTIPPILQGSTVEWVAISFSNECKWKVKVKPLSSVGVLMTPWTQPTRLLCPWGFSRQKYWSGVPLPSLGNNTLIGAQNCSIKIYKNLKKKSEKSFIWYVVEFFLFWEILTIHLLGLLRYYLFLIMCVF